MFVPIINELTLSLTNKTFAFSCKRPANTTSGTSLKSRTRNTPGPTHYLASHELFETNLTYLTLPIDAVGVNVSFAVQQKYAENNLIFMFNADVVQNARVVNTSPFSLINQMVGKMGLLQLNSMQISQNKHLTLLVQNSEASRIDGVIRWDMEEFDQESKTREETTFRLECTINLYKEDEANPLPLYKWELVSKYSTFKNTKQKKLILSLSRKHLLSSKFKVSKIEYVFIEISFILEDQYVNLYVLI